MEEYKRHIIYEPYDTIEEQEEAEERIERNLFNEMEILKKQNPLKKKKKDGLQNYLWNLEFIIKE